MTPSTRESHIKRKLTLDGKPPLPKAAEGFNHRHARIDIVAKKKNE